MTLFVFLVVLGLCWLLILAEVQWYTGDFCNTWKAPVKFVARILRPRHRAQHPFSYRDLSKRPVVPYRAEPVMPRQPWEKPNPRQMARDIALAEAAVGIDLPLDPTQPCPVCGHARLLGARYCSDCRYDWEPQAPAPHALLCRVCERRIPDDSRTCPYCGVLVYETDRLWHMGESTLPTPVGEGAWRCPLCGMVFTWHHAPQPQERPRDCTHCGAHFDWNAIPTYPRATPPPLDPTPALLPPNPYPGNPALREYDTSGADLVSKPAKPKRAKKGATLPTAIIPLGKDTKGRAPTAEPPAAQTGSPFALDERLIGTQERGWPVGRGTPKPPVHRGEWMRTPQGWVRDGYQPRTYTVHELGRGTHTITEGDNLFRHGHAARLGPDVEFRSVVEPPSHHSR